jgi:hypothetical protein
VKKPGGRRRNSSVPTGGRQTRWSGRLSGSARSGPQPEAAACAAVVTERGATGRAEGHGPALALLAGRDLGQRHVGDGHVRRLSPVKIDPAGGGVASFSFASRRLRRLAIPELARLRAAPFWVSFRGSCGESPGLRRTGHRTDQDCFPPPNSSVGRDPGSRFIYQEQPPKYGQCSGSGGQPGRSSDQC